MTGLDWMIIAVYAGLMLGIGLYYSRRNRSTDDYVLGGRTMSPIAVGLSLFATLVSSLSYLAMPGEIIGYGPMVLGQMAAYPFIIAIVGYGIIPVLMRQPVTSAYQLLESRLGTSIRLAAAGVFVLLRLCWMATILYATSYVVLVPIWNLNPESAPWLSLALGAVTVAYATSGGLRAVVMTDAIQAVTMFAGAIVTVVVVTVQMGDVSAWWPHEWPAHWATPSWGFDPDARLSFGMLVLSTILWHVCTNGSDQMAIQRFFATRDAAAARRTLIVSTCSDIAIHGLLALTGLALLGYYQVNVAELASGESLQSVADQLFPRFIISGLPSGLSGLVIAAILAAAMSSLSSGVNSTAAVLSEDFMSRLPGGRLEGLAAVSRMKRLSWLVGTTAVAMSMLNSFIEGNLIERCFKIVNLLTAPLFVLFFLALFVPWANAAGAWLGLLASIATAVIVAYSRELGMNVSIGIAWILPSSLLVGVVVGVAASALFHLGKKNHT
jgi:SSS family solute:Na+ symporter